MLGQAAWIIPVMVAISAFGGLSVHIMTSSRMLYVGARNGHFPAMLSHLNVNKMTPMPSLVFLVSLIAPSPEPMLFIIFLEHSVSLHASYE